MINFSDNFADYNLNGFIGRTSYTEVYKFPHAGGDYALKLIEMGG